MAMITIFCINKKLQRFNKEFNDLEPARKFIIKCGYSNNICVEGFETTSSSCEQELSRVYRPSRFLLSCLNRK